MFFFKSFLTLLIQHLGQPHLHDREWQKNFPNISVCCYKFEAIKFFVKIKLDCCASVMHDKIKRSFNTSNSQWPQFAKFLQKWNFTFFFSFKQDGKRRCHDGNFVIATICEILQKFISIFFLNVKQDERKRSVVMVISRWPHLRNFAKINFDFFLNARKHKRKRRVMMAISRWPPFPKFCKN